jgi:hypothetical protein
MADKEAKKKRTRKPSAFKPQARVTVSIHADAGTDWASDFAANTIADSLSDKYATRVVHRTREGAKEDGIPSYMVYVAPQGFEFATATQGKGGVRLDKDTADALRAIAASMGLDPSDSESIKKVAQALAAKVAKPE